jgi:hypothetical protein
MKGDIKKSLPYVPMRMPIDWILAFHFLKEGLQPHDSVSNYIGHKSWKALKDFEALVWLGGPLVWLEGKGVGGRNLKASIFDTIISWCCGTFQLLILSLMSAACFASLSAILLYLDWIFVWVVCAFTSLKMGRVGLTNKSSALMNSKWISWLGIFSISLVWWSDVELQGIQHVVFFNFLTSMEEVRVDYKGLDDWWRKRTSWLFYVVCEDLVLFNRIMSTE